MPKYLVHGLYSAEGFKGLLKETAGGRKASISKTYEALGGRVEAFYLTEEDAGIVMIAELPDAVSGAALTLVVQASGAFASLKVTQLYGVDEIDQAIKKSVGWRPPGK